MYHVDLYARVRRACMVEGMSLREASRVFGRHRDTVRKLLLLGTTRLPAAGATPPTQTGGPAPG